MEFVKRLTAAIKLIRTDPQTAAEELDSLAATLQQCAAQLRLETAEIEANETGGAGTRARMRVVGPDGLVKQETLTIG